MPLPPAGERVNLVLAARRAVLCAGLTGFALAASVGAAASAEESAPIGMWSTSNSASPKNVAATGTKGRVSRPTVRGQSPVDGSSQAGQVPLGRTDPSNSTTRFLRRNGRTSTASDTIIDSRVSPAQYVPGAAPPPTASPPGGYGSPNGFAPGASGLAPGGGPGFPGNPAPAAGNPQGLATNPDTWGNPAGQPSPFGVDGQGQPSPDVPIFTEPPTPFVDLNAIVQEGKTGNFNFGVGVNSNAGLIGNIIIDEQNFDWKRIPRSVDDFVNGTAFRGGGQQFRIQASPGTLWSTYGFNFREPYLWDTHVNFGLSGSYFMRFYQDWTEKRTGGHVSWGYQFTPDLSGNLILGAENVNISNPFVPTPPQLQRVLGNNALYTGMLQFVHDTRDSTFLATQGHRVELDLEQAWGTFTFPRAMIGMRQHFLVYERPDGSGRQVLNLYCDTGFTGSNTPIFENFFAGGYNTLRGFYFRGASPKVDGVQVGGTFSFINSVEYMLPVTADDSLRLLVFTDFGAVEPTTELKWNDFRIAPGIGILVSIPALGPAPLALYFAVPVKHAPGDQIQNISFNMGASR